MKTTDQTRHTPKRLILPAIVITLHCMASMAAAIDSVAPAEVGAVGGSPIINGLEIFRVSKDD